MTLVVVILTTVDSIAKAVKAINAKSANVVICDTAVYCELPFFADKLVCNSLFLKTDSKPAGFFGVVVEYYGAVEALPTLVSQLLQA